MLEPLLEAFAEAFTNFSDGPRWMRVAVTAVLLSVVLALLTVGLWWPR